MRLNRVKSFYAFLLHFAANVARRSGQPWPGHLQGWPTMAAPPAGDYPLPGSYKGGRLRPGAPACMGNAFGRRQHLQGRCPRRPAREAIASTTPAGAVARGAAAPAT
ncbi:hypothetical protein B296_00017260 [Ensete ventricosum]|uniref:Uncharacterized protein n=1 Tax=Ensete ventricosum TaxID=4639 RepID=A0A426Z828_ENSVE|nr:hypothetical protein B296_00017260 [Ensete ventricosum]